MATTATTCCAKSGCKKGVHVESEYHTCSLCRAPIYCSDECRIVDWVAHDCPNVMQIQGGAKPMFAPYRYEDMLTQEELATLPVGDPVFQERAYLFHNDNRNVVYSQIEGNAVSENGRMPQVRGAAPPGNAGSYTITVRIGSSFTADITNCTIPHDMIYAGNTSNAKARTIAGFGDTFKEKVQGLRRRLYAKEGSLIFWPGSDKVKAAKIVTSELGGDIELSLKVAKGPGASSGASEVAFVRAGYMLSASADGFWRNTSRAVKKALTQNLRLKFPAGTEDIKQLQVLSYADSQGNGVLLTWSVDGMRAQLVDVEFMTPKLQLESVQQQPPVESLVSQRFICDPRNVTDVMAICMALDEHLATQTYVREAHESGQHKQLELYAGVIKNHAYALQEDANAPVTPQLSVAIAAATDALYNEIGASASWWDRKAHGGAEVLDREVQKLVDKLSALRSKTGKINSVRKGALVRELRTVSNIISQKIALLRKEGADVSNWDKLRIKVDSAMQPQ